MSQNELDKRITDEVLSYNPRKNGNALQVL